MKRESLSKAMLITFLLISGKVQCLPLLAYRVHKVNDVCHFFDLVLHRKRPTTDTNLT